jgi:hypothetical protein
VKKDVAWLSEHRSRDGELTFRIGRVEGELVAEWPGIGRMFADARGVARWEIDPDADAPTIEKIKRGVGRALLRHLEGRLSIHAGAAALNGRAVACIGESGTGKSTLMADFCRRYGASLYADDIACLELEGEEVQLLPGERTHWVDPPAALALGLDHEEGDGDADDDDKHPVEARLAADRPSRLVACVALLFDDALDAPVVRPMRGLDAMERLVPSLARFALDDARAHLREHEQLQTLARRVRLLELRRPRNLRALAASSEALARVLEEEVS